MTLKVVPAHHEFVIPDYLPTSLNVLLSQHWAKRNRTKKAEAELIAFYARQAAVPPARGKRHLSVTFTAPGGRGAKTGDKDNRLKVLLDGCVKAGLLVDDSPAWCEVVVTCTKGVKATLIVLEDVT